LSDEALSRARAALGRGDLVEARRSATAACDVAPESVDAWFLLGAACHRAAHLDSALGAFEHAARLVPTASAIANARASVLSELGRVGEARQVLEGALDHGAVADVQLLVNLGIALEALDEHGQAERRYDEAIAAARPLRHPAIGHALQNLGALLMQQRRFEEALSLHEEFVALAPRLPDAHFNLAENLLALDRPEAALAAADRALHLDSRHVFARIDRAFALALTDRLPEAQAELQRARSIDPTRFASYRNAYDAEGSGTLEGLDARMLFVHWHLRQLADCNWSRYAPFVKRLKELLEDADEWPGPLADPGLPFGVLGLPIDAPTQGRLARNVARARQVIGERIERPSVMRSRKTSDRLRVGYVSPDFHAHPTAYLTRQLFRAHDRSRIEVFAYSLFAGDDDGYTHEIQAGCDAFRRVATESTRAIVDRIAGDRIDVLVDLAGYTAGSRPGIFNARPAPIQVTWLGFAGTTGNENIDYAIVDRISAPEGSEAHWSEQLVYLPASYYVSSPTPLEPPSLRSELGLPGDSFVFCCFNNAWKIEPTVFGCWLEILRSVPNSVLWLLGVSNAQVENLRATAAVGGIDPARLVFARIQPHARHLARVGAADLFLDTFLCNAHTTAIDTLWAGVPVLSCAGTTVPSRVCASLLNALGLDELVTKSHEAYVAEAIRLACEPVALAAVRAKLQAARRSASLFDPGARARSLERAFTTMWNRHEAGLPPASFEV